MNWREYSETDQEHLAKRIAANLVSFGYPGITAQFVLDELANTESTSVIRMFAVSMLEENGIEVS